MDPISKVLLFATILVWVQGLTMKLFRMFSCGKPATEPTQKESSVKPTTEPEPAVVVQKLETNEQIFYDEWRLEEPKSKCICKECFKEERECKKRKYEKERQERIDYQTQQRKKAAEQKRKGNYMKRYTHWS